MKHWRPGPASPPHGTKWAPPWTARLFELKDIVGQVAVAVRQIAKVATPAQLDAAKALLAETRRGLYRILAEEPEPAEGADTPPS